MKETYKIHRFNVIMRTDQARFEQFLNSLEGEVVSVIPNVSPLGLLEEWDLEITISG